MGFGTSPVSTSKRYFPLLLSVLARSAPTAYRAFPFSLSVYTTNWGVSLKLIVSALIAVWRFGYRCTVPPLKCTEPFFSSPLSDLPSRVAVTSPPSNLMVPLKSWFHPAPMPMPFPLLLAILITPPLMVMLPLSAHSPPPMPAPPPLPVAVTVPPSIVIVPPSV